MGIVGGRNRPDYAISVPLNSNKAAYKSFFTVSILANFLNVRIEIKAIKAYFILVRSISVLHG